jgi:antitoxin component YwqK of YwqJK toxin-antitoxin module
MTTSTWRKDLATALKGPLCFRSPFHPNGARAYDDTDADEQGNLHGADVTVMHHDNDGAVQYRGGAKNGYPHGSGTLYSDDGLDRMVYVGEFVDGRPSGYGTFFHESGELLVKGHFRKGCIEEGQFCHPTQ